MERLDIYDQNGQPTGRVIDRGARLAAGDHILVVQLWIRDELGQYLIQQRAHHLVDAPGIWATTAGHVQAGEDSRSAALRELDEEMGLQISPDLLSHFLRFTRNNIIQDVWVANVLTADLGGPVIGVEVAGWMWASREKIEAMVASGDFFPYRYLQSFL